MRLKVQKRIAQSLFKVGKKRIKFDPEKLSDIKEAITKGDLRGLVSKGTIKINPKRGRSRFRARERLIQKRKGRRKGKGSRKGRATARAKPKKIWMAKIRLQRLLLKTLKEKSLIDNRTYKELYLKAKGGFFRSKRHLKTYMEERKLLKNGK